MWKRNQEGPDIEPVKCPVCNKELGRCDKKTLYKAHCEECKATFTWHPKIEKPTVLMDKDIKKFKQYCDNGNCYCKS